MFTIYLHRNKINNKIYIGYSGKSINERWYHHCHAAKKGKGYYFQAAIRKHGENNFSHEIIDTASNLKEAKLSEVKWIAHHKSNDPTIGYNLTNGGDGSILSKSTIEKMRVVALLRNSNPDFRKMISEKTKEAMSSLSEDKKQNMLVVWDEATRKKASDSAKARCTDEWKKKHSEALTGRHATDATKLAISNAWTEEMRQAASERRSGKSLSVETKEKISKNIKSSWSKERRHSYSERMKKQKPSKETQEKKRQKMLALYADPIRREEYLNKRKLKKQKKEIT